MLTFAGSSEAVRALSELARELLRDLPVAWEETRFVSGEPGELTFSAAVAVPGWPNGREFTNIRLRPEGGSAALAVPAAEVHDPLDADMAARSI